MQFLLDPLLNWYWYNSSTFYNFENLADFLDCEDLKSPIPTSLDLIKPTVIISFDIYVSLLFLRENVPRKRSRSHISLGGVKCKKYPIECLQ